MVVVDADCKIVPDRIAGESDNLYVASLNIWTQVHKPLNHPIDVNRFIYPRAMLINQDTMALTKIIFDLFIKNVFELLLVIFSC